MDSKVVRADFGSGLICTKTETNSEWFMRAPRDAYPGAQTCCASPTQTPARLANSRRTWSRRRTRKSKCVPSRWKVLSGEFRRRPTALARNFANRIVSVAEDCLSPERTFHGCSLMRFRGAFPRLDSIGLRPAEDRFDRITCTIDGVLNCGSTSFEKRSCCVTQT